MNKIPNQTNNKLNENINFWHKFNKLNLNGKQSRIPIKKSRIARIGSSLIGDQIKGSESVNHNPNNNFINDNKSKSEVCDSKVKLRSVRGRSGLTSATNGRTRSEPIDLNHLKAVLEIIRSHLSADYKFRAIKRYRDKRLAFISEMQTYSDSNCDERVREWVDSGYMSNTNSIREPQNVFTNNESKPESAVDTTDASTKDSQQLWSRRRSYNYKRAMDLIALNNNYNSFNSDISMSSISSIESLLESRREDPEELLLALGFGYVSDELQLNRIPQRFLESQSSAKGVNPETFRKSCGLIDFSSLSSSTSFSPTDTRERSFSCGRIGERFRKRLSKRDSLLKIDLPEIVTSSPSLLQSPQTESILNPANRKFLESQGKQEDNPNHLGSKRLIIGTKSYKLDSDGDPLAFPKTPSPQPLQETTSVQTNNQMDVSESNSEQISFISNDNSSESNKRKKLQRQKCVSDPDSSMTDLSSELSSSTTTLVGTVISGTNESAANNTSINLSDNFYMSFDKRNTFSQTDNQLTQISENETIEAAFEVAIQSLRLSLEFYKHQSIKLAKLSAQKYEESSSQFTEEDINRLSNIHKLRENIHKELTDMDTLLNKHLNELKTSKVLEKSFVLQAQVFIATAKKMTEMLKEQQNIYSRMDFMKPND